MQNNSQTTATTRISAILLLAAESRNCSKAHRIELAALRSCRERDRRPRTRVLQIDFDTQPLKRARSMLFGRTLHIWINHKWREDAYNFWPEALSSAILICSIWKRTYVERTTWRRWTHRSKLWRTTTITATFMFMHVLRINLLLAYARARSLAFMLSCPPYMSSRTLCTPYRTIVAHYTRLIVDFSQHSRLPGRPWCCVALQICDMAVAFERSRTFQRFAVDVFAILPEFFARQPKISGRRVLRESDVVDVAQWCISDSNIIPFYDTCIIIGTTQVLHYRAIFLLCVELIFFSFVPLTSFGCFFLSFVGTRSLDFTNRTVYQLTWAIIISGTRKHAHLPMCTRSFSVHLSRQQHSQPSQLLSPLMCVREREGLNVQWLSARGKPKLKSPILFCACIDC